MSGSVWASTLVAVAFVCSLSLIGAVFLGIRQDALRRALLVMIAFASGGLLGDAFLHLLPQVAESTTGLDVTASMSILAGLIAFFILEKVLHWHHAHVPHAEVLHPIAITNLVGDGLHNLMDGALIAGAFAVSTKLGIATSIAVAMHEIPQELGDFGILIHSGLSTRRALLLNLLSSLIAFVGAILTLTLIPLDSIERYLIPFTAGTFIYIASTDLIPELHKEPEPAKSFMQLGGLLVGVGVMALLLLAE